MVSDSTVFYTLGMSLIAPTLTLLVMDLFPNIRGTVASCQSFTQTMLGAVVSGLVTPFFSAFCTLVSFGTIDVCSDWIVLMARWPILS